MPSSARPPLSTILPPLIFGTATFNYQYNTDPYKLPTTALVQEALSVGVRAFDTSPYYGPSEEILGKALAHPYESTNAPFPRRDYYLVTKVGRINGSEFNYTAPWVRHSIARSLARLHTSYLDVVYCHDVEFVTPAEVLVAVRELRRIRDQEGTVHYIGISGYPVDTLCELAELVLRETGEPLDAVMSYANFTLQNQRLEREGLKRLQAAGVDVVPNASILGMGLLRRVGVPIGATGNWHPAPDVLRGACHAASDFCDSKGEKLEVVSMRWALERWLAIGGSVGSRGDPASGVPWKRESIEEVGGVKLGVSVIGVSKIEELEETMRVWRSVLDGMEDENVVHGDAAKQAAKEWSLNRRKEIRHLAEGVWKALGEYRNFAWDSPGADYVREGPGLEVDEERIETETLRGVNGRSALMAQVEVGGAEACASRL